MDDIRRGEIFYIARGGATNGSEQFADRPAVVVSNDENNKHSGVIEVVYMTTQPKTDLPTHVTVRSTGRLSTVLCEQVSSVSTDRVSTMRRFRNSRRKLNTIATKFKRCSSRQKKRKPKNHRRQQERHRRLL